MSEQQTLLGPIERADLEIRVDQFLNRWHWRGDRAIARRELVDLIAFATDEVGVADVCRNAGCQEIR